MNALAIAGLLAVAASVSGCSQDYRSLSTVNGRQAIIDEANNFLTIGECQAAIDTMAPLYNSAYADTTAKLVMSSAYACLGGMNFPKIFTALDNPANIWSAIVKANYSAASTDGHITNLSAAADILRTTSAVPPGFVAQYRPKDANAYMIFLQVEILGSVISVLGAADPTTGNRTQAFPAASNANRCLAQVAMATMIDSIAAAGSGSAIQKVSDALSTVCGLVGGGCPTNKDVTACGNPEYTAGQAILSAIESQW